MPHTPSRRVAPALLLTALSLAGAAPGQDSKLPPRRALEPMGPTLPQAATERDPSGPDTRGTGVERDLLVVDTREDQGRRPDPSGPDFAPDAGSPFRLEFPGGSFEPAPGLDPRLARRIADDPDGASFGYVMVTGSVSDQDRRAELETLGVELLNVHTWQSHVAKIPHRAAMQVLDLPQVRWIGFAEPQQKLSERLAATLAQSAAGDEIEILVNLFQSDQGPATVRVPLHPADATASAPGSSAASEVVPLFRTVPNGPAQRFLEALGCRILSYADHSSVAYFTATATPAQIEALCQDHRIAYLERSLPDTLDHDQTMAMIQVDRVRARYDGTSAAAGVIDSGLNTGFNSGFPLHGDMQGKSFVGAYTVGGTPFIDNNVSGHGSHVTGTMAADGGQDIRITGCAPGLGEAPGVPLYIGRYFGTSRTSTGDVSLLYDFMKTPSGTRPLPQVINCSWGSDPEQPNTTWIGTEAQSRLVDGYVHDEGQLYVFSSGNSGLGVGRPAVAKNVLTVGAVFDTPGPQGEPVGDLASFSARGTRDNRAKPEVVAPGIWVTSISNLGPTQYREATGTSMAAPHVAGTLAGLVGHYPTLEHKPATMKALACATSQWQASPGTRTGVRNDVGYGLIDAHRMHYIDDTGGALFSSGSSRMVGNGQVRTWTIPIPADAQALKVVTAWTEDPASAGATRARVNDLRMYVDVEPFDPANNVGDFSPPASSVNNVLSIASQDSDPTGLCAAAKGKLIRIKVYGQSVPSTADVGMALMWLTKVPDGQAPRARVDSPDQQADGRIVVQALQTFGLRTSLVAPATSDAFQNAAIRPNFHPSVRKLWFDFVTADGRSFRIDNGNPTHPAPGLGYGMTVGAGFRRDLLWRLQAPGTSGLYGLSSNIQSDPPVVGSSPTVTLCVDDFAPPAIANFQSSSHQPARWTRDDQFVASWLPTGDNGCAGLEGYAWTATLDLRPSPRTITGTPTANGVTLTVPESPNDRSGVYFAIRGIDRADNLGTVHTYGPLYVDKTPPVISVFELNSNAPSTGTLDVRATYQATDLRSGISQYRYTLDGQTWSPWASAFGSFPLNLDDYGGNRNPGVKRVDLELRDQAGNVSNGFDTITYLPPPRITRVVDGDVPVIGNEPFVLEGTNLDLVDRVEFDAVPLQTDPAQWLVGYYRIVSPTRLEVFPPQALLDGFHFITAFNNSGSTPAQVRLSYPLTEKIATASEVPAGGQQLLLTHCGNRRGPFLSYIALSPSNQPSVLPGYVSLQIGNNFSSLETLATPFVHDGRTGIASTGQFPVPQSLRGGTLYFQALVVDPADPARQPIPVSDVTSTTYR